MKRHNRLLPLGLALAFCVLLPGCGSPPQPVALLDAGLTHWEPINFGGEGEASYKDGALNLDYGSPLTGVVYAGDPAELLGDDLDHYEVTFQTQRVSGLELFCGFTFPVGTEGHVSFVLGGWAGTVCGISELDYKNASENETTTYHSFVPGQWYAVRVRVTPEKIQCWVDDEVYADVNRADVQTFTVFGSVTDTKPLGLFSYQSWGAFKDIQVQRLD